MAGARAAAPGAYGWVTGRWVKDDMIVNGGLRAEWFTPGEDARSMPNGAGSGVMAFDM